MATTREQVTQLLSEFNAGDAGALDRLMPVVYEELKRVAKYYLSKESNAQTLQPTLVVNDAIIKLLGGHPDNFAGRAHFFGVAARAMRQVLVTHARAKRREKRGGEIGRVTLHADLAATPGPSSYDILDFEAALEALTSENEQLGKMVELRFYAGLDVSEVAEVLGVSKSSVERGLRVARAFLGTRLAGKSG